MERPEDRPNQLQKISAVEGETPGGAEEKDPKEGHPGADPHVKGRPAFEKERLDDGDEDNIKTGDEAGVGRGGVAQPGLLQTAGSDEQRACDGDPSKLPAGDLFPIIDEWQQNERAKQETQPVEKEGAQPRNRNPLNDKRRTPDECDEEKSEVGTEAFIQMRLLEMGCALRAADGFYRDL